MRNVLGAYRCMGEIQGCTDVRGIKMYRGHTDVWRVYRCKGHTYIWGCTGGIHGVYICMGDVQKYGQHTDVWGCTNAGVIQPTRHTDSKTYPHMPANYIYTIFLITFKFNPYRHILLAYHLA